MVAPHAVAAPAVVVVGSATTRSALGATFASWGWTVLALVADDLAGVAAVRRSGADVLVIDGSGFGSFGDLDLARTALAPCAVVRLVDRPQELVSDPTAVLAGVPARRLREALLLAMTGPISETART